MVTDSVAHQPPEKNITPTISQSSTESGNSIEKTCPATDVIRKCAGLPRKGASISYTVVAPPPEEKAPRGSMAAAIAFAMEGFSATMSTVGTMIEIWMEENVEEKKQRILTL